MTRVVCQQFAPRIADLRANRERSLRAVAEAIDAGADVVVLATWLDQTRELVPDRKRLLEDKVVVDPSNPIGFDEEGQMLRTLPKGESSGSVVAALLKSEGFDVVGVITVLDRLAGGAEKIRLASDDAPYEALATIDDVYPERPDRT